MSIFNRRFRDMMLMDYDLKNQGGLLGGQQGATGGLLGGLSNINPNLLIGAQIAGAGFKGVDPFSAITPAVLQTAQIQKLLAPQEVKERTRLLSKEEVEKRFPNLPTGTIVQEKPGGELTFKEPSATTVKEIVKLKGTVGLLDDIEKDYKSLNKPVGGVFGVGFDIDRLKGQIGKFTGSEKGKQYSKFLANIDKTTTFLTQAISGAAVSEAEAERIRKLIPQVTDREAVFEAKLESLRDYLNDARKNYGDNIVKAVENLDISKYEKKLQTDIPGFTSIEIGADGIWDVR
jgi:hypothetical protein